jgi:glycine dehydrogenase
MSDHSRSDFARRHIGPDERSADLMLSALEVTQRDDLWPQIIPASIRRLEPMSIPEPVGEVEALDELRRLAGMNTPAVSMIGMGYHDTHTPAVIVRNVLENPGWYTAYTPYQPEISQGRLEVLLAFQTMIEDLTGLPVAGASLLDEPTAVAEAMSLMSRVTKDDRSTFVIDADTHPQTLAVVQTRAEPLGIVVQVADLSEGLQAVSDDAFGLLVSYPGSSGRITDPRPLIEEAKARNIHVAMTSDLLALTLLTPPGEMGVDIVVGSAQRFGVPMACGGPHAGFMSVRAGWERHMPGRLVGVSVDSHGDPAYRLALQTREQHIRREKATSNICTAQVLLAVVSALYAAYHGPRGLVDIAQRVHGHASSNLDGDGRSRSSRHARRVLRHRTHRDARLG